MVEVVFPGRLSVSSGVSLFGDDVPPASPPGVAAVSGACIGLTPVSTLRLTTEASTCEGWMCVGTLLSASTTGPLSTLSSASAGGVPVLSADWELSLTDGIPFWADPA